MVLLMLDCSKSITSTGQDAIQETLLVALRRTTTVPCTFTEDGETLSTLGALIPPVDAETNDSALSSLFFFEIHFLLCLIK
jgi:hypothetical protein